MADDKPEYFVPAKQAEKLYRHVCRKLEDSDPDYSPEKHNYLRGMKEVLASLLGKIGEDEEGDEDW